MRAAGGNNRAGVAPAAGAAGGGAAGGGSKPKSTLGEIQRLQRERDERRRLAEDRKMERAAEEKRLREAGNLGDVDFVRMVQAYREEIRNSERRHAAPGSTRICICVRKRPINAKETAKRDHDCVSCLNPSVVVHACKLRVDGITKYLDNQGFEFDHTFNEEDSTDDVYMYTAQPLVEFALMGGRSTVFAYGQTGSGKTHTMTGIQRSVADDLFYLLNSERERGNPVHADLRVFVAFFEIYGGRCQDLLNHRNRLNIREDGNGEVVVGDLEELEVQSAEDMAAVIDTGNQNRTTHATESNDVSSRSHAICQIVLRRGNGAMHGKYSLIDLAGSERAADTMSNNRQRRMEGSEINKSLLALKECIRALADNSAVHVPYRASKLTLVLKDSFARDNGRTAMIATVSPAMSSADHTINTLRYADRVKERPLGGGGGGGEKLQQQSPPQAAVPRSVPSTAPGKQQQPPAAAAYKASPPSLPVPAAAAAGPAAKGIAPSLASRVAAGGGLAPRKAPAAAAAAPAAPPRSALVTTPVTFEPPEEEEEDRRDAKRGYRFDEDEDEDGGMMMEDDEDGLLLPGEDGLIPEPHDVLSRTIEGLFEEEEALLNMHMSVIQENAELLTEEGRLLQQIQGDDVQDYDIDAYADRLDEILQRKQALIDVLRDKLAAFKAHLRREEKVSATLRIAAEKRGFGGRL